MGTNVDPVCGDDKSYLEKIAGGGVTPRYLGTYQTLAALKADWPDSIGDSMKNSWAVAAGTSYSYGGAGVGWNESSCGPIYNGTTLPFPIGGDCSRIRVVNPAVPKGWSWLEWNGTIWAPPAGELIASSFGSGPGDGALADVSPATLSQTVIWQSATIPNYMLPANSRMHIAIQAAAINASGVSGCALAAGIATGVPTTPLDAQAYNAPVFTGVTPTAGGVGFDNKTQLYQVGVNSDRGLIRHSNGGTGRWLRNAISPSDLTVGTAKFYFFVKPSHIADRFILDGYAITSLGNI